MRSHQSSLQLHQNRGPEDGDGSAVGCNDFRMIHELCTMQLSTDNCCFSLDIDLRHRLCHSLYFDADEGIILPVEWGMWEVLEVIPAMKSSVGEIVRSLLRSMRWKSTAPLSGPHRPHPPSGLCLPTTVSGSTVRLRLLIRIVHLSAHILLQLG